MKCGKCDSVAVIVLQHGALCAHHFLDYFESKVEKTIKRFDLFEKDDVMCVAASGGKDSLTVLHLTKKYTDQRGMQPPFALAIDEGIGGYREHTLVDLEKFCKERAIPLHIVKSKEVFGASLDEAYPIINKDTKKKPCNICGVWRRYMLNKEARKLGATKVVTGHNLDDEAQAILMNWFKANTSLAAGLGPKSGVSDDELFVQRVKPLYFVTEKETRLYCLLKKFQVDFTECPYAQEGYRAHIRDTLNDFEAKYAGTKHGIVTSFLAMLPLLKAQVMPKPIGACSLCGEPAQKDVCHACSLAEVLNV